MSILKGHVINENFDVSGSLIERNDRVYSCVLNQTDIDANKNKFYIMQLIKNVSSWSLYSLYGRVGDNGVKTCKSFSTESEGLKAFERQFKSKTGNSWIADTFEKKAGKYFLSEVSYEEELKDVKINDKVPESKLPEKVQKLMTMLSDQNMMNNAMVHLDIDTKKMPLGKLKQTQLDKAGEVLDNINNVLVEYNKKPTDELKKKLIMLSSEYYTYLPGNFGRRKPPIINSEELINKYRDTLDELRNMVVAVQIKNNVKVGENPLDSMYNDINTRIVPLEKDSIMWKEIEKYLKNTHGATHEAKLELIDIFEVEQIGMKEKFNNYCDKLGNKTLLIHGTPQNCVLSIFKNMFYLDPTKLNNTNVCISGKLLGYGIYFSDCFTKSYNYTKANNTDDIGCLILSEVALGNISQRNQPDYNISKQSLAKTKHHSAHGIGRWEPKSSTTVKGLKIPNGPIHEARQNTYLRYNEFVVYDINQILIKYLVIVKNKGGYGGY